MANRIVLNETSYHGAGAIKEIAGEVKTRGFKKAFVCSDPDLVKFGVTKKVTDVLDDAGLAYEIYSNISYPDLDDANYGSGVAAALRNEQQAKSLMEQGDENTDDQATMRLQYDQAEAKLAKQAQGLMITY